MDKQLTLAEAIRAIAMRQPDHTAVVSTAFQPLSYRDLQSQLDEIRHQLRRGGYSHRAQIGLLVPTGPVAAVLIVAVACSAVAVPLDPRQTPSEFEQRLQPLCLDAVIIPRGTMPELRQVAAERNIPIIDAVPFGNGRLGMRLEASRSVPDVADSEPPPDAPSFILQTSGTSGQPKLIPFSHTNMLAAAARTQDWFGLGPADRCLSLSPPYYSQGLKVTAFTPLLTGGSIAFPANAAKVDLVEWFDVLRPTWYPAGPTLHRAIWDHARELVDAPSMHCLRFVQSGGAPLPMEVREGLEAILQIPVLEHYGSSEASQVATNLPPPGPNKPGTCGQPWPGTVGIFDETGRPVPPGQMGEIWVRGPTVISGYLNAPDLNDRAFVGDWFRTDDLGSIDTDGFLHLHGRVSDLINRGGEKISPFEIESALLQHPAVAEAAAFAVPHSRLGQDAAAAVVLRPGSQTTPEELRDVLRARLVSFKVPRRISIVNELPRGATGKVQRRRLADALTVQPHEPAAARAQPDVSNPVNLERELLKLWRRLLRSETLTVDDGFFESGGDSLLATEMLIEAEALVGQHLPETVLFEADTIRKLVRRITEPSRPIPRAQPNDEGTPLFFFHGDFSNGGLFVRRLVSLLGPDQPVVLIDPHGVRGEPIPATVEEMASDRLPLILDKQASGPFILGGHCNGALVAFEAARLLRTAGHDVKLVAMVDAPTASANPVMRIILRLMKYMVSSRALASTYTRMIKLERKLKKRPAAEVSNDRARQLQSDAREPDPAQMEAYAMAMARYVPEPLDVPVAFYAATFSGQTWRYVCSDLEVIELPGGHHECVVEGAELFVTHFSHRLSGVSSAKSISGRAATQRFPGKAPLMSLAPYLSAAITPIV